MNSAKRHPPSRRDVVSAGTVGLALASSQAALAQGSSVQEEREDLRDPQEIYQNPRSSDNRSRGRDWQAKWILRPDHGENSYRGSEPTPDRP